ncbi:MAG: hypothetical protein LBQ49_03255 [Rickettsiales bacterium]|jgi:hypothetical protein|nr:hypothetical protein [Rickettsiales bacterium]
MNGEVAISAAPQWVLDIVAPERAEAMAAARAEAQEEAAMKETREEERGYNAFMSLNDHWDFFNMTNVIPRA